MNREIFNVVQFLVYSASGKKYQPNMVNGGEENNLCITYILLINTLSFLAH